MQALVLLNFNTNKIIKICEIVDLIEVKLNFYEK